MNRLVTFEYDTTEFQRKYIRKVMRLKKPEVIEAATKIIAEEITPYVPKGETGNLRKYDIIANSKRSQIIWGRGLDYAHYQWAGVVYAPNYPVMRNGVVVGWHSPAGSKKYPTDRMLGGPGVMLDRKGNVIYEAHYTTANTTYQWDLKVRNDHSKWRNIRQKVSFYLRREVKNA